MTCYSIAANFYPENKTKVIGILDATQGLGSLLGPFFGTLLFMIRAYDFMLYAFGTSFIACSLLASTAIPTSIDMHTLKEKEADREVYNMSIGHLSQSHNSSRLDVSVANVRQDA